MRKKWKKSSPKARKEKLTEEWKSIAMSQIYTHTCLHDPNLRKMSNLWISIEFTQRVARQPRRDNNCKCATVLVARVFTPVKFVK